MDSSVVIFCVGPRSEDAIDQYCDKPMSYFYHSTLAAAFIHRHALETNGYLILLQHLIPDPWRLLQDKQALVELAQPSSAIVEAL